MPLLWIISQHLLWSFAPHTIQSTAEPAAETSAERPIWVVHRGSFRVYGRESMRGRREFFRFPSKEGESVLLKHFELASPGEGLGAVAGVELPVDVARVRLHRAHGDKEIPGNLRVGPA